MTTFMAENKDAPNGGDESSKQDDQFTSKSRTVMVFGEINEKLAQVTVRRLLALAGESDKPITVLVCSPGGHVEAGDAIHDMIRFVNAPVYTVGTGWVGSAAAHIFLAAPKERRLCLPNTRFLIHQPAGGAGGQATDIAIQAEQIIRTRARIAQVIATQTGQPLAKVAQDIERDFWMNPEEALSYGLISRVIQTQAELTQLQG
jgi:ATP-dependent Clp protease, protease subunit